MKSSVALNGEGEGKPSICEASRRLAEKANAGIPLADRLANKSGAHPGRAASMPSELQECVHAPSINHKSERLAMQLQAKAWANGQVTVEDRLIAAAPVHREEEMVEQKPVINPNSEKILARRGPMLPLEERLQQNVGHRRGGVGSEVENCTLAPSLSTGTQKMLAKKGPRPSFLERQEQWAKQHARGDVDPSLADMKYRFDKPEVDAPVDGVKSSAAPSGRGASVSERAVVGPALPPDGRKTVRFGHGSAGEDRDGAADDGADFEPPTSDRSDRSDGASKPGPTQQRPPLVRERDRRAGKPGTPRGGSAGGAPHQQSGTPTGAGPAQKAPAGAMARRSTPSNVPPPQGPGAGRRPPSAPPQAPPPVHTPEEEDEEEAMTSPKESVAARVLTGGGAMGTPGASRSAGQGRLGLGGVRSGLLAPGSPAIKKLLHRSGGGASTPSNESAAAADSAGRSGAGPAHTPGAGQPTRRAAPQPMEPGSGGSQLRPPGAKPGARAIGSFAPPGAGQRRPQLPAQARGSVARKQGAAGGGGEAPVGGYVDGYEGADGPVDELGYGGAAGEPAPFDEYDELLEAQEVERAAQRARALADEGEYGEEVPGGAEAADVDGGRRQVARVVGDGEDSDDDDDDVGREKEEEESPWELSEQEREAQEAAEEAAAHRERRRAEAAARARAEEAAAAEAEAAAAWAEAESSLFGMGGGAIKAPEAFVPDAEPEEASSCSGGGHHGSTATTPAARLRTTAKGPGSRGEASSGGGRSGGAPRTGSRRRSAGRAVLEDPEDCAELDRATAEFEQVISVTNTSPSPLGHAHADAAGRPGRGGGGGGGGGGLAELLAEAEHELSHGAPAPAGALSPERAASARGGGGDGVAGALSEQLSSWCDAFERQMGLAGDDEARPSDRAPATAASQETSEGAAVRVDSLLLSPRAARDAARRASKPPSAADLDRLRVAPGGSGAPARSPAEPPADAGPASSQEAAPPAASAPPPPALQRTMSSRRTTSHQAAMDAKMKADAAAKLKAEETKARVSKQIKEAAAMQVAKAAAEARAAQEEAELTIEGATKAAASAKLEATAAQEEIVSLKQRLAESEAALGRARGVAREVSAELDAMRQSVRAQGEAQRLSEAQCATLRRDLEEATEENERTRKELAEEVSHERERREKDVTRLTSAAERDRARLQAELDDVREQLARRDQQLEEESTGLARKLEKELHERQRTMSTDLLTAQQALSTAKRQHAIEMDDLAATRDEALQKAAQLEGRAKAAEEGLRRAQAELEITRTQQQLQQHQQAQPAASRSESKPAAAAAVRVPLRKVEPEAVPSPQPQVRAPEPRAMEPKVVAAAASPKAVAAAAAPEVATGGMTDVERELQKVKEALRKSEEEQLGAALRARRKEKALKEQLRKQALMGETRV